MVYPPPGHENKMDFGQYRGMSYQDVLTEHTQYAVWASKEPSPSVRLKEFVDWWTFYYTVDEKEMVPRIKRTPLAREWIPAARRKAKARPRMPKKPNPCEGGCDRNNGTRAGSNNIAMCSHALHADIRRSQGRRKCPRCHSTNALISKSISGGQRGQRTGCSASSVATLWKGCRPKHGSKGSRWESKLKAHPQE